MTETEKPARILRLQASNVKRLTAVSIEPDGDVVVIGGRNGQGKSSVLDAIEWALHGAKAIPSQPLRQGAEKGEAVVELSNGLLIRRTFTPGGGGTLTIGDAEGRSYRSPQSILDAFYDELGFDPLMFSRLKPAQQRDSLQQLVGLDFSELDARRQQLYDDRTRVNRDIKSMQVQLETLPRHDGVGVEEVRFEELLSKLDEAERHNDEVDASRNRLHRLRQTLMECDADIKDLTQQLAEAKKARANLMERIESAEKEPAGEKIDIDAIRDEIRQAEDRNEKVRQNMAVSALQARLQDARGDSEAMTEDIRQIDADKARMLSEVTMPIDGLAFTDSGVLYKGVPFDQCSSAEQLRVSAAMGMAMSPRLRVMLIRDGSLMDDESMAVLAELAKEHEYQIWVERVGDAGQVVIEDGQVRNTISASGPGGQVEPADAPT